MQWMYGFCELLCDCEKEKKELCFNLPRGKAVLVKPLSSIYNQLDMAQLTTSFKLQNLNIPACFPFTVQNNWPSGKGIAAIIVDIQDGFIKRDKVTP